MHEMEELVVPEVLQRLDDAVLAALYKQNEDVKDGIVTVLREERRDGVCYKTVFKDGHGYALGIGMGKHRSAIQESFAPVAVYFDDVCENDMRRNTRAETAILLYARNGAHE